MPLKLEAPAFRHGEESQCLNSRFYCDENENAIASMKSALESLESRTKARINRGVEGLEVA